MARVSVEQQALTDARFSHLGRLIGTDRHGALGRMLLIWNECQEHATYFLPARTAVAHLDHESGAQFLVDAGLAEWKKKPRDGSEGVLRIKGTEGRVEWLAVKRERARENGRKGGRPPQNQSGAKAEPTSVRSGLQQETPPAPAPAPAPAQKTEDKASAPAKPAKVRQPRPRCEVFDAIAEATGSDPGVTGSHIARIRNALKAAEPPYTAADVAEFHDRFADLCPWSEGRRPTLGEIEKYIGLLRSGQGAPKLRKPGFQTHDDRVGDVLFGGSDHE